MENRQTSPEIRAPWGADRARRQPGARRDGHLAVADVESSPRSVAVRGIARGIYPPLLAGRGLAEALRAQAAGAAISVTVIGGVPRTTEETEEGVYFSCTEAIQNASQHAGRDATMTLWLHHHDQTLTMLITDDGRGFNPVQTTEGAGLQIIRDRIDELGGTVEVASEPGSGTVLTISLPWPSRTD